MFVIIWSFLVLTFNCIPCCEFDDCGDEISVEQKEHKDNACENCSPFLSCGSCNGFVIFYETPDSGGFSIVSEAKTFREQKFCYSEYTSSIWQPPQVI
ncbi:hypothetical protein [Salinimicrobium marinum]|uniref:hypothetical protein n=1 Tax=Salinimicrobium marinum TaxID=680283 RepID=UPI0035710817